MAATVEDEEYRQMQSSWRCKNYRYGVQSYKVAVVQAAREV